MARIKEFEPLTEAEETLLRGLSSGEDVAIGNGRLPAEGAGEDRQIRGPFLRELILDAFEGLASYKDFAARLHEKGVRLAGARITEALDLEGSHINRDIALFYCRFDATPVFVSARIENLFLDGSVLPGFTGDRLKARGDVFLRKVVAKSTVRLLGAKLGGDLSCTKARFTAAKGAAAFWADGLEATGGVALDKVTATGAVLLLGTRLGGDLNCIAGHFNGTKRDNGRKRGDALVADGFSARGTVFFNSMTAVGAVRLKNAMVGANLECDGARFSHVDDGAALDLEGTVVSGALLLRNGTQVDGGLDLTGAQVARLDDTGDSWPQHGRIWLNRFVYDGFNGSAPTDAAARIDWLDRQDPARWGEEFWPQPWEQCAKVLREMGHRDDARKVLIAKEKRQRAAARARIEAGDAMRPAKEGLVAGALALVVIGLLAGWEVGVAIAALIVPLFGLNLHRHLVDWILWGTIGYGHRPLQAALALFAFWFLGALVFTGAELNDAIKPNSSRMFRAAEWANCRPPDAQDAPAYREAYLGKVGEAQLTCYLRQPEARAFPGFSPLIYSADTLLPIVDLEMQGYWIPDDKVAGWGVWARRFLWVQIFAGWALSLLAVAGFSGLIRTDSK